MGSFPPPALWFSTLRLRGQIRWVVAYTTANASAEVTVTYCYSSDQATGVHPVDVGSWLCKFASKWKLCYPSVHYFSRCHFPFLPLTVYAVILVLVAHYVKLIYYP